MENVYIQGSPSLYEHHGEQQRKHLEVYRRCEDFLALGPEPKASLEMVLADLEISRQEGGCFCGIYGPTGNMLGVVDFVPGGFEGKADTASQPLMIACNIGIKGIGIEAVRLIEKEIQKDAAVTEIRSGVQVNNPKPSNSGRRTAIKSSADRNSFLIQPRLSS